MVKPSRTPRLSLQLARELNASGRWQEAIDCYLQTLSRGAQPPKPDLLALSILLRRAGRTVEAKQWFIRWAERHYVRNDRHRILYCPIPKVACTFFKRLLIEQSEHAARLETLHPHETIDKTPALQLRDWQLATSGRYFRFLVLRCPFKRVVSAYLNKFATFREVPPMARHVIAAVHKHQGRPVDFDRSVTFREFVLYLLRTDDSLLDEHWIPQHRFVEEEISVFDYVAPMDAMESVIRRLEKITGTEISRQKTANANKYGKSLRPSSYCDWFPKELRQLDFLPDAEAMLTSELRCELLRRYQRDLALYESVLSEDAVLTSMAS